MVNVETTAYFKFLGPHSVCCHTYILSCQLLLQYCNDFHHNSKRSFHYYSYCTVYNNCDIWPIYVMYSSICHVLYVEDSRF
jgi:hypothetical protein